MKKARAVSSRLHGDVAGIGVQYFTVIIHESQSRVVALPLQSSRWPSGWPLLRVVALQNFSVLRSCAVDRGVGGLSFVHIRYPALTQVK